MLTVEDMKKASEIAKRPQGYGKDKDWFISQRIMVEEFLKKLGIPTNGYNPPFVKFEVAAFLVDKQKVKSLLSLLNNKAFW